MKEAVLVSGYDEIAEPSVAFNNMIEDSRASWQRRLNAERMRKSSQFAGDRLPAFFLPLLPCRAYDLYAATFLPRASRLLLQLSLRGLLTG